MRGSRAALVVLWLALAAVVVVSGWVGVHVVGRALAPTAAPLLSDAEMDALLATASPSLTPTPKSSGRGDGDNDRDDDTTATPPPGGGGGPGSEVKPVYRTFRSRGGSAVVSCAASRISLESWSPAVGYRLEEKQVQTSELEVSFEGSAGSSKIHASCESGVPVAEVDSEVESGSDD